MFGSPQAPPSKDLNLPYPAAGPFGSQHAEESETDALRRRQQQQKMSYGLLRYQSAPSSLLGEECGAENEAMFARLLAPDLLEEARTKTSGDEGPQFPLPPPEEVNVHQSMIFHRRHQQTPNHSSIGSSFTVDVGSFPMETGQIKKGSSNLIRQSSSPAGLFSYFAVDNGYGMPSGIAGFRDKGQLSFSSRQSSVMSQISEMDSENVEGNSDKEKGGGAVDDDRNFMPERFPVNSLDDSFVFNNTFFSLKGGREGEVKTPGGLSSVERRQDGEVRNHASGLPHQLNLPNNSSAMAAMENFLHLHDAVPCKIRAKRGCATHPRSIAERVRRTRISDRMRRLQELVPNMDKQTNTADMLDLAVDYMKDLQKQVKALSEIQANCNCSASRQKPY